MPKQSRNARNAAARNARIKSVLNQIKLESGCMDCGYNEHAAALSFDHRDPELKSFSLGVGIRHRSIQSILDEVDKCDVRCQNCHTIKHWEEVHEEEKHGAVHC